MISPQKLLFNGSVAEFYISMITHFKSAICSVVEDNIYYF
jgi:hypothetical protein